MVASFVVIVLFALLFFIVVYIPLLDCPHALKTWFGLIETGFEHFIRFAQVSLVSLEKHKAVAFINLC